MNERAKRFKSSYSVKTDTVTFDPNSEAKEIAKIQLKEFAELVKGTPNEELIAFKNPKVQELIDYIMATIIIENQTINAPDAFPIEIHSRYKSDKSLSGKLKKRATERKGK